MKLEVGYIDITDIQFSDKASLQDGVLYVDRDAITAMILEDERIRAVGWTSPNRARAYASLRSRMLSSLGSR